MRYNHNDKIINIPDEQISNLVNVLGLSQEEAIQTYLEDEGYCDNEEQNALEKKAKDNKITAKIHQAKGEKKTSSTKRERKPDIEKEDLIAKIAEYLSNIGENVEITNKSKIIEFNIGENHYKLDLIRQRKPKK